jgi:hypothetical protein
MLYFPSSRAIFGLRSQPAQAAWRRARASAMLCTTTATTAAATSPASGDAGSNCGGEDASIVVIPARYGSTRFPGKPLAHILGRPMVVHTMERASKASSVDLVAVATDHQGIKEAVEGAGGTAVMTRREHETGTDRVREALEVLGRDGGRMFGIVVNVQGDEALVVPPPSSSHIPSPPLPLSASLPPSLPPCLPLPPSPLPSLPPSLPPPSSLPPFSLSPLSPQRSPLSHNLPCRSSINTSTS